MNITNSECVSVALFIRHGKYMHRIIFSSVICLTVPCFSTLPHKGTVCGKIIEYKL